MHCIPATPQGFVAVISQPFLCRRIKLKKRRKSAFITFNVYTSPSSIEIGWWRRLMEMKFGMEWSGIVYKVDGSRPLGVVVEMGSFQSGWVVGGKIRSPCGDKWCCEDVDLEYQSVIRG
jgi:hypothetical protein